MCNCVNVPMGSYANQTTKIIPWKKQPGYLDPRYLAGIDNCLLEEIEYLWNKGVRTIESCCGHNVAPAYIAVDPQSIDLMLWLGYEFYSRPYQQGFDPQIFWPKSPTVQMKINMQFTFEGRAV